MSLYIQPSPDRSNDNSLPTAPDAGVNVGALIDELSNRINQATRKLEHMVDSRALAKIILTDRDIVLMGDQVSVVGQVNIVDWIRDVSGNPTGGIDRNSITRIVGGRIQTGIIESTNWSVSSGSQFDLSNGTIVLGGSASPKFSVNTSGNLVCQDATVRGTITAGSFIQSSVQLDDEFGPTLADLAAGSDIQGALDAGVTNILAGVGTDFRLNVDTVNALVTFQHKDAVFFGTAAAGSTKPALGISSSGIGIGYNRSSDGAWQTSIAIDASGNVALIGTLSAGSIITGSVTVSGTTLTTIASRALDGFNISDLLANGGTKVLKGVLVPTDAGAIKTGSITWNSTTGALTGGTGMAMTEYGLIGASSGSPTLTFVASTGDLTISGLITGGSDIDITGKAVFTGQSISSGAHHAAVIGNDGGTQQFGLLGYAGATFGAGVYGDSKTGTRYGVYGVAATSSGVGVRAFGSNALACDGAMTMGSTALVSNLNAERWNSHRIGSDDLTTGIRTATFNATNKPGSSNTGNTWLQITFGNGEIKYIPVWA